MVQGEGRVLPTWGDGASDIVLWNRWRRKRAECKQLGNGGQHYRTRVYAFHHRSRHARWTQFWVLSQEPDSSPGRGLLLLLWVYVCGFTGVRRVCTALHW